MGLPPWAVASPERRAHIERVVGLLHAWASAMHVPAAERARWLRAGWLHDALRDAPAATELEHGPLAAARAAADGERDKGVLDAVRYHSVGYAGWELVGRMLYLADFLDPGRAFDRAERAARAALAARLPEARDEVLVEVARRRTTWALSSGWPLPRETVDFWNSLIGS